MSEPARFEQDGGGAGIGGLPLDSIAGFCRRHHIRKLALFGSVLRDDFGPDSDVDVLVTFAEDEHWRLGDFGHMRDELDALLGRKVDLVERQAVEENPNWIIRKAILGSARRLNVA